MDISAYFGTDQVIVYVFLVIVLLLGIYFGRDIKDVEDYATAKRKYATPVVIITLLATEVGGGSMSGGASEIFRIGIIATSIYLGITMGSAVFGKYLAPKFDSRFKGMISAGDMISKFYGEKEEKFTGIIGFIMGSGIVGAQLTALGYVMVMFFPMEYWVAVLISGGIVVIYSTLGGIKSVATTDVMQFAVLIVFIPLIASIALDNVGGFSGVLNEVPASHFEVLKHENIWIHISLFTFYFVPFHFFYPTLVQRYLMAGNPEQVKKALYTNSLIRFAFTIIIAVISFSALALYPEIKSNTVIPTIIEKLLPVWIKGFAICGMLAVIMSTADSWLNSTSIIFVHNFIRPKFENSINELKWMRVSTFFLGVGAILFAIGDFNIVRLIALTGGIWSALIGIPLFAGLIGMNVTRMSFWVCAVLSTIVFVFLNIYGRVYGNDIGLVAPFASTVMGCIGFFGCHIIQNKKFVFDIQKSVLPRRASILEYLKSLREIDLKNIDFKKYAIKVGKIY